MHNSNWNYYFALYAIKHLSYLLISTVFKKWIYVQIKKAIATHIENEVDNRLLFGLII